VTLVLFDHPLEMEFADMFHHDDSSRLFEPEVVERVWLSY
jgi:hypothetical protein